MYWQMICVKTLHKSLRKWFWIWKKAKVERATISMIQSMVEHRLLGAGYITIAEHYISYRLQRDLEEVVMEIISRFIYILNKFAKKKSGMKQLHLTLS